MSSKEPNTFKEMVDERIPDAALTSDKYLAGIIYEGDSLVVAIQATSTELIQIMHELVGRLNISDQAELVLQMVARVGPDVLLGHTVRHHMEAILKAEAMAEKEGETEQ